MSKKLHTKSSKRASSNPTRGQSAASAKTKPRKSRGAAATKTVKTLAITSREAPSKRLRSTKSAQGAAEGAAVSESAKERAKAPSFRLPRDGGAAVSLADFAGKNVVLFFYPRAGTPGCTQEAIDFTRLAPSFAKANTAVLGVSGDSPEAQAVFRNRHKLAVPLISDEKHKMLQAYGAWGKKSMYGRTFEGIIRTTVLIGTTGKIVRIWRRVRVGGHAEEVLAAARTI